MKLELARVFLPCMFLRLKQLLRGTSPLLSEVLPLQEFPPPQTMGPSRGPQCIRIQSTLNAKLRMKKQENLAGN